MNALLRVILKEFLQLKRDRRMIPVLILAPVVQLLALGYAANNDVLDIPTLLVDMDRTAASRALVDRFTGSGYFELVGSEDDVRAIDPWLLTGRAQIALVIREGFGHSLGEGKAPQVQVIADGTDSTSAVVGLGYASRIVSAASAERVAAALGRLARAGLRDASSVATDQAIKASIGTGSMTVIPASLATGPGPAASGSSSTARAPAARGAPRIELDPRVWYNPDLKSRWFYVPAILAMTLMLMTMILPSMAVVREKEIGTMEQIIVTPIRSWQLIIGKLFPFLIIGYVNLFFITSLVVYLFGVPLRGTLGGLVVLTIPFLLTNLALGLFVSTIVRNQQQAMLASMFFLMVPMIYLSGLIFPIENMPIVIQKITYAIPLRYYVDIIRGVFLKGSGVAVLWPEMATLSGFAVATITLASLRFRKRLD